MKRLALILILSLHTLPFFGQGKDSYAYFYIEGTQETPFYVKVEGQMQPRYGQNYFIIPHLGAGYTHIEILFQQNKYPPQKFLLDVPQKGFRGFTLKDLGGQQFALYDLQQKKTIPADNTREEDAAVATHANFSESLFQQPKAADTPTAPPKVARTKQQKMHKPQQRLSDKLSFLNEGIGISLSDFTTNRIPAKTDTSKQDAFLEGIVLNESGRTDGATETSAGQQQPTAGSDCPNAMSNEAFEGFARQLLRKDDDDDKLKFLKNGKESHCFSTEQVRIITNSLHGQAVRYDAVKMLYRHTSDPEHYPELESLFNTPFLKEKFRQIINPAGKG